MDAKPVVQISEHAAVRGKVERVAGLDSPVHVFRGIPYAEPPVGGLRFLPTKPLTLWEGEKDCTQYGAIPVQDISQYDELATKYPFFPTLSKWNPVTSEDCLFLNVFTPVTQKERPLPVMVWIHGGGFTLGSVSLYDLTAWAGIENIVCVSISYRVGVFGFLTSGDDVIPGNVGLLDQVEALKWVQKYVSAFGGDPNNVTIFGNSAGGMSASLHMVSDRSRGLFKRVICSSGVANSCYAVRTREQEFRAIQPCLQKLGYSGNTSQDMLAFLQSKTDKELFDAFQRYYKVVIDGDFLKDYPDNLYCNGHVQKVDVMSGHTRHEAILMIYILHDPDLDDEPRVDAVRDYVKQIADSKYSENTEAMTDAMMDLYIKGRELPDSLSVFQRLVEISSDQLFIGPSNAFMRHYCGMASTYGYFFDYRPSYSTHASWVVSDHLEEIPFVMGYPFLLGDRTPRKRYTDEEKHLSRQLMSYFANFIRTGNPNHPDLPSWPAFTQDERGYMVLKPSLAAAKDYAPAQMDFWDEGIRHLDTSRAYNYK